jgi:hypothetical protein
MMEVVGSYAGTYPEDDGFLLFHNQFNTAATWYAKGMSGVYSNYVLNQRMTYVVNTTWSVDYVLYSGVGISGLASSIANPSTVQFTNLTGVEHGVNTIWNNSVGIFALGSGTSKYLQSYINDVDGTYSAMDSCSINTGTWYYQTNYDGYITAQGISNVYYTTVVEYDLYHKQITAYLCDNTVHVFIRSQHNRTQRQNCNRSMRICESF